MALDFSKTASTKTAKQRMQQAVTSNTKDRVVEIPVEKLRESPFNKNMPVDGLNELAESIKNNGLQEALLVYSIDDGCYEIYAGHRRYLAMRDILHEKTIPCIVKKYPESAEVRFREHLINNAERRDNNFHFWLAEIIAARTLLISSGFDGTKREQVQRISELLEGKISVAQIYRYEAIEKSDPSLMELAGLGYSVYSLNPATSLPAEQQKTFSESVLALYKESGGELLTQKELSWIIESMKEKKETSPKAKNNPDKYIDSLSRLETRFSKTLKKPKNEAQLEAAKKTISSLRLILDEFEKNLNM